MWLEYLLLRDGSVELLTSPTLMKKEASKDAFCIKEKKTAVRETEEAVSIEETVNPTRYTVTVP